MGLILEVSSSPLEGAKESMSMDWLARVESLAQSVVERNGCRIYDLEWTGTSAGRILRVFIDAQAPKAGISLDDCEAVSQGLNLLLDVEDLIPGSYTLEVSSPGLERKLKKTWHFDQAVEKTIKFKLKDWLAEPKLRSGQGVLKKVSTSDNGDLVELEVDLAQPPQPKGKSLIRVPGPLISEAQTVFEIHKGQKKGQKRNN